MIIIGTRRVIAMYQRFRLFHHMIQPHRQVSDLIYNITKLTCECTINEIRRISYEEDSCPV